MKKAIFICALVLLAAVVPYAAFAHQPYLINGERSVIVLNPQVSKAYYGDFPNGPVTYRIRETEPFNLYVGLLVPAVRGIPADVSAEIFRDGESIATLFATSTDWKPMYEPYGGDDYLEGPEFRLEKATGTFSIVVSRPSGDGQYVVAIGEKETFTPDELLRTISVLPELKTDIFGKPAWTAYINRIGIYMLTGIVCLFIAYLFVAEMLRKFFALFSKKKRVID